MMVTKRCGEKSQRLFFSRACPFSCLHVTHINRFQSVALTTRARQSLLCYDGEGVQLSCMRTGGAHSAEAASEDASRRPCSSSPTSEHGLCMLFMSVTPPSCQEQVKQTLLRAGGLVPCPKESSCGSLQPPPPQPLSSVFVFWLVTVEKHVVTQRPMPSPEQVLSAVRPAIAAAAASLARRGNSAIPLQREDPPPIPSSLPPPKEAARGRGEEEEEESYRMRMQWEGNVAVESVGRQNTNRRGDGVILASRCRRRINGGALA